MEHGRAKNRKRKMVIRPVTIDLTDDEPSCVVDLTESDDVPPVAEPSPAAAPASATPAAPSSTRDCPVCMDAVGTEGPITALGCFHIFCRPCIARCITTQLERHRSPDCPVCKRLIPPEEQRTCGVEPSDAAGGPAAYGPAIDMFAVDLEGPGPADAARLGLMAAFPHAHGRDLHSTPTRTPNLTLALTLALALPLTLTRRDLHRDPMLLLDQRMQQQRSGRTVIPRRYTHPSASDPSAMPGAGRQLGRASASASHATSSSSASAWDEQRRGASAAISFSQRAANLGARGGPGGGRAGRSARGRARVSWP